MTIKCPECKRYDDTTTIIDHLVDDHFIPAENIWFIPTGRFNVLGQLEVAIEIIEVETVSQVMGFGL